MMKIRIPQTKLASLVSIIIGSSLILSACDTMSRSSAKTTTSSTNDPMSSSVEDMTKMAMGNMKKVMMMSPDDQKKYVMSTQSQSLDHGKDLFASASLGNNGFTCATCHPGGKTTGGQVPMGKMKMAIPSLQGVAANFPKFKPGNDAVITLSEMNNNCVVMFLKGQPITLGSPDARDLAYYITSLSTGEAIAPGKQGM